MKNRPWLLVFLLWGVALLNYLDRQLLSTLKTAMQVDVQELQSAEVFGNLMAVFLWVYGVMSPFAGWIADRVNRSRLIVISLCVWSAVTLLMGLVTEVSPLFLLRAIMGISEALYIPAALSLIAESHTGKSRSLAVGIHMSGLYCGQALGGFGATAAAAIGWKMTFVSLGLIGIAYALLLYFFLHDQSKSLPVKPSSQEKADPFGGFRLLFSNPSFWIILLCFAVPSLPGWGIKNWVPTLFAEKLGIDMTRAGPMATITIAVSSFAGVLAGGALSDKWVQTYRKGRILVSGMGLFLMVPALFLIGYTQSIPGVVFSAALFGIGFGFFDANNMPILCQFVPEGARATGYGLMNMTGVFAGAAVTSWLGKSVDAGNLGRDFSLMAAFIVLVILLQWIGLRPSKMIHHDKEASHS